MEDIRQKQQRPSVLQQVPQTPSRGMHFTLSDCKEEVDASCIPQFFSSKIGSSYSQSSHHFCLLMKESTKKSPTEARFLDGMPDGISSLFLNGLCRWPGCDAVIEDFPGFLKHLHSEHSYSDRSIAQWKVQQDIVQCMESQVGTREKTYNCSINSILIMEKQKLIAMQLHLHLYEKKYIDMAQPQQTNEVGMQQWGNKQARDGFTANGSSHYLPDLPSNIECYKYNDIRPPYTYACLIRWCIMKSPDKQRTLNEIYNWFTTMFFFFRNNTATWKNAVRHNLSLHKCFVRVEGGKGAVWTVDEAEYKRTKGQKYYRTVV